MFTISTGELAGFLNHQQYFCFFRFHRIFLVVTASKKKHRQQHKNYHPSANSPARVFWSTDVELPQPKNLRTTRSPSTWAQGPKTPCQKTQWSNPSSTSKQCSNFLGIFPKKYPSLQDGAPSRSL